MNIEYKEAHLGEIIRDFGSVAVAFSAGTDSTYLLAICHETLGAENVLAVTARSVTLPEEELQEARKLAEHIGVQLEILTTYEIENPEFASNDIHRCYHCQLERVEAMWHVARDKGLATVAFGNTTDDLGDYRPGMRVAQQQGVRMPLIEARMDKSDVRYLSELRGLPNSQKPSLACLATRIPYGKPLRIENLEQVAQAELFLRREIGLPQVRVRHHERIARLEVEPADIARVVQPEVRERIIEYLKGLGFTYVTLDLDGFRSGSMNEGLELFSM
jgi:uncharacterized protein